MKFKTVSESFLMNSTSSDSARDFYHDRSDRTRRYLAQGLPPPISCVVSVSPAWASHPATQQGLETLCNLVARFCPTVTLVLPRFGSSAIDGNRLINTLRAVDPYGRFAISDAAQEASVWVQLGDGSPAPNTINWWFQGWSGGLGKMDSTATQEPSAAGAEMGACLAGAAAFRFWIEGRRCDHSFFGIDLFNLAELRSPPMSPATVADETSNVSALMVGAGSVGSAAAYFMPRLGIRGTVDVVDHDKIKRENMDRSPIFVPGHETQPKVTAVCNYLRSSGLTSTPFEQTWAEFVRQNGKLLRSYSLWLPLANEHDVRRSMQENYPPVCIQASTGKNWNVSFGRHIPFKDDCQLDRFPPDAPVVPMVCSTGKVAVSAEKQVDAALPFASFIAGLFVAAATRRAQLGHIDYGDNYGSFIARPEFSFWTQNRRPQPGCECQKQSRNVFRAVWGLSYQT